jgi:hypothetical protein
MRHSDSAPPHTTAGACRARIQSAAMPSALAPDEHAVDTVTRGPRLPISAAIASVVTATGVSNHCASGARPPATVLSSR